MDQGFNIADVWVQADAPVTEAIVCLERSGGEVALVVDANRRLVGTVTDGDVRRGLLRGKSLNDPVSAIMNASPRSAPAGTSRSKLRHMMQQADVKQLPLLDAEGRILDLVLMSILMETRGLPNSVVIMAGGLGTRLLPLTESVPKPMIEIGGKPILHTIIEGFVSQGFYRFTFSLNYLGEQIEAYFGDGSAFDAEISYIRETKRLGTAGALSLMTEKPADPIFVMNGDILTSTNFTAMLRFHEEAEAIGTMGVNHFHYKVPYGVVDVSDERIVGLREKPEYDFFVNSGIYVLSPEALDRVPRDRFFDMPSLFQKLMDENETTAAFPIHEHWLDVGQPHDLKRAEDEFDTVVFDQGRRRNRTRPVTESQGS